MDVSDIFDVFYDFTWETIRDESEELEGNLWDIIGEERGLALTGAIKDYFFSIPREYDIYIPISEIALEGLPESIQMSGSMSFDTFRDGDAFTEIPSYGLSLLGPSEHTTVKKFYLRQRLRGYCASRLENITLKNAVRNYKIILQIGIFRDVFNVTENLLGELATLSSLAALSGMGTHQIPRTNIVSVDRTANSSRRARAELPIDFSKFTSRIVLNSDVVTPEIMKVMEELKLLTVAPLMKAVALIKCEEEEAQRVRSAILWYFDSQTVENQTLAFLQVCIGLEALLGDDGYNGALTETLADRCSYLLSKDIKGRKILRERFIQLYTIRSKLVHGNAIELDKGQEYYLRWGRNVLRGAIMTELKNLNLGTS